MNLNYLHFISLFFVLLSLLVPIIGVRKSYINTSFYLFTSLFSFILALLMQMAFQSIAIILAPTNVLDLYMKYQTMIFVIGILSSIALLVLNISLYHKHRKY